eukprot:GDKI01023168.1.p1 GENE.GDKI01023168.1~~GDKI01023168.1.p1  ORF type:complete len:288 (-),score=90.12 GDKI01023168.1:468-1292(-)
METSTKHADGDAGFAPVRRSKKGKAGMETDAPYGDRDEEMQVDSTQVLDPISVEKELELMDEGDEKEDTWPEEGEKPEFAPISVKEQQKGVKALVKIRRILVPNHRYTPLRAAWMEILQPLVEHMKLQVRMNTKRRCVEVKTSPETKDIGALQKAADFLRAYMLGFDVQDAIALLRLDDLFLESFEVKDVKRLAGDHLSRCIGRISGKDGKTKYAVENATRTRIVLADSRIHILGSFHNIRFARDAICSLILGSPPGKVYNHLRTVSKRMQERI